MELTLETFLIGLAIWVFLAMIVEGGDKKDKEKKND